MKKEGKRKALSALVCGSMLTVALVGGTLAYLTDAEGKLSNSFTRSNAVDITLSEIAGVNGTNMTEEIIDGSNGGALESYKYENVVPGDELTKQVTVANKDTSINAYVEVTVTLNNAGAINAAIDNVYEKAPYNYSADKVQAIYDEVFNGWGINYNPRPGVAGVNDARGVIDGACGLPANVLHVDFSKTTDFSNDTTMFGINNWFMSEAEAKAAANGNYSAWLPGGGYYTGKLVDDESTTEADERDYTIVYTYYVYLPAGASTTLFEGLNIPSDWNSAQLDAFDDLKIEISAKAIQAANFANAQEAFEALHGDGVTARVPVYQIANFDSLNNTVKQSGQIEVSEDIDSNNAPLEVSGNPVTVNGNNHKFTLGATGYYGVIANAGSATTLNDMNIESLGGGVAAVDGAKITFNSGSVAVNSANTSGRYNFYVVGDGTEVTINGGEFSFSKTLNQKRAYIYAGPGATVYVNGGVFGPASTRSGYTAGILGEGNVIIKGGTFGFDPTSWVAEGYQAVKSGSTWTVSAIS